jgi:hydroxymethylbilane synthase
MPGKKKVYKIGTRGSLLAVTQCTLIKNEIEEKTGEEFELITIQTQGDQIVDKPLWQLEGKDFFTKELDHALLTGEG